MVSIVEVISPPITTVANGFCTSAPAEVESAIGKKPIMVDEAVNNTGRKRSFVPRIKRSFMSVTPSVFNSFKCSINTMPLSTAIPNRAIKPTPAEILKGIPRIHNSITPPTTDKGTAENTKAASRMELNAKCRKINMSKSDTGTASFKRLVALLRFSNCPPYSME